MSQEKPVDNGGPAFPTPSGHATVEGYQEGYGKIHQTVEVCRTGMTLRDYFAAKALQGLLSCDIEGYGMTLDAYAEDAYRHADAMLKARSHRA